MFMMEVVLRNEGLSTTVVCLAATWKDKKKKTPSTHQLCHAVQCIFRCKVLVLSRYCTVDGTFLCLLYVSNVQKRFIVSLFIISELCVYFYIVKVLIIRMLFWESQ